MKINARNILPGKVRAIKKGQKARAIVKAFSVRIDVD